MAVSRNPIHKTLRIIVHADSNNGEKKGTFTGPPPKMRLTLQDLVRWDVQVVPNDPSATFTINFSGGASPFKDAGGQPIQAISDNQEHPLVTEGLFHYNVAVNTGGQVFNIGHCPELDVDGNPG